MFKFEKYSTLLESFLRVTLLPSRSSSSILIEPVASACWLMWKLGAMGVSSSTSTRFLLARDEREELLLAATLRETMTLEGGLGDRFSLWRNMALIEINTARSCQSTLKFTKQAKSLCMIYGCTAAIEIQKQHTVLGHPGAKFCTNKVEQYCHLKVAIRHFIKF